MIEVKNLSKSYGKNRGVNNISFSIPEGQVVGFLGPNGAGKTTTMNIITGYLSADSGNVKIGGIDILENPFEAKRKIGYLPESPPLYTGMTVKEYLNFVYELKKVKVPERKEHLKRICKMMGLIDVYPRVIGHLSKGFKQRVGLAQALIGDPDVLILDEPTIGLDPKQIVDIRNVIKTMGKRSTILLSTHILPEVSAICERVLVISNGIIVADDKPENLAGRVTATATIVIRVVGSKNTVRSLLNDIAGVKTVEVLGSMEKDSFDYLVESEKGVDTRIPIVTALGKARCHILMLRPRDMSLEDIFLKLTQQGG